MPADRPITLHVSATGDRDDMGRYIPGQVTDYGVWATRMDKSLYDVEQSGGNLNVVQRTYRIRFISALEGLTPDRLELTDQGQRLNAQNITEVEGARRRFYDLEVIGEIAE